MDDYLFDYLQEQHLLPYIPSKGEVAIDIGCNIGQWTRYLAQKFKIVHAIDAQSGCLGYLNGLNLNIITHHIAAWSNLGKVMFRQNVNCAGEWQGAIVGTDDFIVKRGAVEHYEVACSPVDCLPIEGQVEFIKVDVDGSEVQALIGCQRILREHKPTLLVETHSEENRAYLQCWLKKLGYKVEVLDHKLNDKSRWTDEVNYFYAKQ